MTEPISYTCCFCDEKFLNNDEFWDHMNLGTCNLNVENEEKTETSIKLDPSPHLASLAYPSPEINPYNFDFTKLTAAVPTFNNTSNLDEVQKSANKLPVYNNFQPRISLPTNNNCNEVAKETISDSSSKWKCTLCDINFPEKSLLLAHVKCPEHNKKLPISANVPKLMSCTPLPPKATCKPQPIQYPFKQTTPLEHQKEDFSNSSQINYKSRDEMVKLIHQIFQEELRPLIKKEIMTIFRPLFEIDHVSNQNLPPSVGIPKTKSNSLHNVSIPGSIVSNIMCDVCNCPVAAANYESHLFGKRHQTALKKTS